MIRRKCRKSVVELASGDGKTGVTIVRLLQCTVCALALLAAPAVGIAGGAIELRPYKDRLFDYPAVLETRDDGAFQVIDYSEKRDIDQRDQIPERRVKGNYVSMKPKSQQRPATVTLGDIRVEVFEIGPARGARFAVIFIHGRGGDRRLGANDWTFGGNFNRLKNLAVRNGGVYYVPSIPSFDQTGLDHLKTLISHIRHSVPQAPIILACGSMGSVLCWESGNDSRITRHLAGIVILGGTVDESFLKSLAYQNRVPVLLAHGSGDSVYDWRDQHALYQRIRNGSGRAYPIRFVLFQDGSHGTPIRMLDWRDTINWILARSG
jgi:pimeloyl-ACP methyl ester carboxylesterase